MIRLRLFGGISIDDRPEALAGPAAHRHRLALLGLLGATPGGILTRDKLIAYLWPDSDGPRARNLLNQSVHVLRRALGPEALTSRGDDLVFDGRRVASDVAQFEAALRAGEWAVAVSLHAGPLLDGFHLPKALEFEEWLAGRRRELRAGLLHALEQLAESAWEDGDAVRAAHWWGRRVAEEPGNGRATLRLMDALEAEGNRAAALQAAETHVHRLRDDFDAQPDPAVAARAERIRARPLSPIVGAPAGKEPAATDDPPVPVPGIPPVTRRRGLRRIATGGVLVAVLLPVVAFMDRNGAGPRPGVGRLAVLPLANLTGDSGRQYLVDGLHDALITELAQLDGLSILARQSVLRFRDRDHPVPDIANALEADYLVEGGVSPDPEGGVRLTVRLVRGRDGEELWSGSRAGRSGQTLDLPARLAAALASAIDPRLAPPPATPASASANVSPEAEDAYLRGWHQLQLVVGSGLVRPDAMLAGLQAAIPSLEAAVALEPDWAPARAGLAVAYHWLASNRWRQYADEYFPRARAEAEAALRLDPDNARAHASLGFIRYFYDWDWDNAARSLQRAVSLDPTASHGTYALFLQASGRHDEAIAQFQMAERVNPLSDMQKRHVIGSFLCAGRFEPALRRARDLERRLDESDRAGGGAAAYPVKSMIALIHSLAGRHEIAAGLLEEQVARTDSADAALRDLAYVYARAGRLEEARSLVRRLEERARARGTTFQGAHVYGAVGQTEHALDLVEKAFAARSAPFAHLLCSEEYRVLRDEPRMRAIAHRIGLPVSRDQE